MFRPVLLVLLIAAGGCTAGSMLPEVSEDHPANPRAARAELPARANLLALPTEAAATRPAGEPAGRGQPEGAAGDPHAGHRAAHPQPAAQEGHGGHGKGSAPPGTQTYACPMHPEVMAANPSDPCPKCGMKINKPVADGAATRPAATHPAPAAPAGDAKHGGGHEHHGGAHP